MSATGLGDLIADPGVAAGSVADPWRCLSTNALDLPDGHAALAAARGLPDAGIPPHRAGLGAGAGFINLGRGSGGPGLILLLTPGDAGRRADYRGTWIAWGLPRPSVNLFLVPALQRLKAAGVNMSSPDAAREVIQSKEFTDSNIEVDVLVSHVMQPLVYRVYADAPVHDVQYLMLRRGLSTVPVVGKEHELLGVIAVSDVLSHILPGSEESGERRALAARDIMKRAVLCVSGDESLVEASRMMIARQVARLPVVREGRLAGFLDRATVLHAFADTPVSPR